MSAIDSEMLAQQVSGINEKVAALEQRMAEVEKVNSRLEQAALTTARALREISGHWDAVYEAMRRAERSPSEDTAKADNAGSALADACPPPVAPR